MRGKKRIMKQEIDINLFYENPKYLFTQLPQKAKDEVDIFLRDILFKYNLDKDVNQTHKTS